MLRISPRNRRSTDDRTLEWGSFYSGGAHASTKILPANGYGAGAGVAAFHRSTTDAVVVLSVFLNPGTGAFA